MPATFAKRVVVTGAGRGLGRAICDVLVGEGADVWATDAQEIDPEKCSAQHRCVMDVASEMSVAQTFEAIEQLGGVDALVNNAGIYPMSAWDEIDISDWRRTLDVNLTGSFLCARAAAKSMRLHARGGSIVNIASALFFKGSAAGIAYTASKGGVVAMTRSFARALGGHLIRVNCVAPGLMNTEGVQELLGRTVDADRLISNDPQRVFPGVTQPSGVAEVVAFLLSDASREMTGQTLIADGGLHFV
jgi:NAD(P)-dependent dehydrogenase (short-subunit alcohol dehydrogenase family)